MAYVPRKPSRMSAGSRYGLIIAFALSWTYCASFQRSNQATLTVDGGYVRSGRGCSGTRSSHDQAGGTARIAHVSQDGTRTAGTIGVIHGQPTEETVADNPSVAESRYVLFSAGVSYGEDWRYWGFELGSHVLFSNGESVIPMPFLKLKFGDLKTGWAELKAGSEGGIWDPIWGGVGAGFAAGKITGQAGFGFAIRPMISFGDPDREIDLFEGGAMSPALYLDMKWLDDSGFGFSVRGILATSYSIELGLAIDLERVFGN